MILQNSIFLQDRKYKEYTLPGTRFAEVFIIEGTIGRSI